MAKYATGKHAKAISDRSGMEFPYSEMMTEWNGSFVHKSEYEPKHPQLDPPYVTADAIALRNPRPLHKSGIIVDLDPQYWEGQFTSNGMQPSITPLEMNNTRELKMSAGDVTIGIS